MSTLPRETFRRYGWAGMVDTGDLRAEEDDRAHLLINLYPERSNQRSRVILRPGFTHAPGNFAQIAANHAVAF